MTKTNLKKKKRTMTVSGETNMTMATNVLTTPQNSVLLWPPGRAKSVTNTTAPNTATIKSSRINIFLFAFLGANSRKMST